MVLKEVALTGASGMVGRHVIRHLSARGIKAHTVSRQRPHYLPNGFSWSAWDLKHWKTIDQLDQLFPRAQALLHVGASVPSKIEQSSIRTLFEANVRVCLSLGHWANERKIPMVYLSGSTVYAEPERTGIRENDPKATQGTTGGFYGFSKFLAEEVLQHLSAQGLSLVILRPSSIYGFGMKEGKMITNFLSEAAQNRVIELKPPVEDRINLIHASDVAIAMTEALNKEAWGIYNIAHESLESVNDIAQTCVNVVGKGKVRVMSQKDAREPMTRFGLSCEAAKKAFGFKPRMALREGLESMWKEMKT
jgi:UDP-glucose 4-epimerase